MPGAEQPADIMSTTALAEFESLEVAEENIVCLPNGILGFEDHKEFVLLQNPEEKPFAWLQSVDSGDLAFLLIPPDKVVGDYRPDINDADVAALGLNSPDDALIYSIVTIHEDGTFTANLKGPIVLNRFSLRGKQVVPDNVADFPLRQALPVNANATAEA